MQATAPAPSPAIAPGDHQLRDGMLVPVDGEVAWLLPEGALPYWRGTITALRYEFGR